MTEYSTTSEPGGGLCCQGQVFCNQRSGGYATAQSQNYHHAGLRSGPFENSLAVFCTSALLEALKINLFYSKKKQMVKLSEVQKCKSPLENFHMVSTLVVAPRQIDCDVNPGKVNSTGEASCTKKVTCWCIHYNNNTVKIHFDLHKTFF